MRHPVASGVIDGAAPSPSIAWLSAWPPIVAAATFFLFDTSGRLLDPDTYLHLAAGAWMLAHGSVPDTDPFSQTLRGAPWVPHEWLAELILAGAFRVGGWAALTGLTAASFAAAAALLTQFLLRRLQPLHVIAAVTLAELLALPHLVARPHVLAMPLTVLWTARLLEDAETGKPSWWLLPVMTLWANLHGGFTLGLGFAGLLALEAVLAAPLRAAAIRRGGQWAAFLAAAVAAASLTPHPVAGLAFSTHLFGLDYSLSVISEWRSPDFHSFQPLELWLLLGLAVALTMGLRLPPIRLVLLLGLVHLALKYGRSGELVGLLGPLVAAAPLARQIRRLPPTGALDRLCERLAAPLPRAAVGGVAVLVLAALALGQLRDPRPDPAIAPELALRAAARAGLTGPVLNAYDFGGYLIFAGIAPYIDGRVDLYGDAFLRQYGEALGLGRADALPELLDRNGIAWTLLSPGTPALALLDRLPGWHRVYADAVAVVHARTGS